MLIGHDHRSRRRNHYRPHSPNGMVRPGLYRRQFGLSARGEDHVVALADQPDPARARRHSLRLSKSSILTHWLNRQLFVSAAGTLADLVVSPKPQNCSLLT